MGWLSLLPWPAGVDRVRTMEELQPGPLESALESMLDAALDPARDAVADPVSAALLDPTSSSNALVFLLIAATGLAMALVYVPVRLYLTITARSRRLRLLQRIRQLREELGRPVANS
jgi:hypothetical protein